MKLRVLSLVLPLALGAVLASARSSRGIVQQAPPPASAAPELPAGPGREPFLRICSGCHLSTVATSERRTAESWATVVDDMRARGANGSDEDMDKITDWLAANYPAKPAAHTDRRRSEVPVLAATQPGLWGESEDAIAPQRPGNAKLKNLVELQLVPALPATKLE